MLVKNNAPCLVSAVVSAFNSENHIAGRLQNLIDQTLYRKNRLEIIVVDSCSPQNEGEITKGFMRQYDHIVYVRTSERESVYGAWNRGIQLAKGTFLINANTDDRFATDALERMSDALDEDYGVHAIYGDWLQTNVENDDFDSETTKELLCYPEFNPMLLFHSQITSHAALMRREVFDKIGLYDDSFKIYGDREFMLRFSVNGFKAQKLPDVVGLYYKNPRGLELSGKDLGDHEFKRLLDQFLVPECFVRLFDDGVITDKKELAQMYARAGASGKGFFKINGKPVSNFGTAGLLFSKALEYDESNLVSLNNLGIISSIRGEPVEGVRLLEKALTDSDPVQSLNIQWNINKAQNGTGLLDKYKWFNIKNPKKKENAMKSPEEMYQEIQPLIENGWYDVAINALEKLSEAYPDFALAHNDLGVLFYKQGDKGKAQANYEKAADLQPENITFQKNLADFYYVESGRIEDALRIYVRILESHPDDAETLLITGHICVALQRFDDAKDFYRRVLEIEPQNADAGRNLDKLAQITSENHIAPHSLPSAEEMYQAAQESAKGGQFSEAIQKLETLLQSSPDFAVAHNDLGVLFYQIGDKNRAREHYEKAAQLEPEDITFQKNLADFYCIELGQFENAMQIYIKILEKYPEDIETLMAIGYICETLDKADDAREFYHCVLEIEPWNIDARQKLDNLNVMRQAI
jgi:Flp pilus assembly protein TadD/GT2 family glycosyltransferase